MCFVGGELFSFPPIAERMVNNEAESKNRVSLPASAGNSGSGIYDLPLLQWDLSIPVFYNYFKTRGTKVIK